MNSINQFLNSFTTDPTVWFTIIVLVCLFLGIGVFVVSFFRSIFFGKKFQTNTLDDYYPLPRKITIDNAASPESGFHVKLNYQILIERITRKLYFLFLLIVGFSTTFIFVLYNSSIREQIAPSQDVQNQYKNMMSSILEVEDRLGEIQYEQLSRQMNSLADSKLVLDQGGIVNNTGTGSTTFFDVLLEQVKSEDQLIVDVSEEFYNIYFVRYIVVRLFVATVMFTLLTYFIRLYFKMREDRYDFIRKEEALSTYFSIIDYIEGYNQEDPNVKVPKRFELLKDKIPFFPLEELFTKVVDKAKKSFRKNNDNLYLETYNTVKTLLGNHLSTSTEILSDIKAETRKISKVSKKKAKINEAF